jgi:LuxR family maltose regulon positive regulatory protein
MDIGEQTIKWHVKNLFTKLGGLNRKHAVARARMLGLLGA